MDITRRSFIRWVIGGAAAAACPIPLGALTAPARRLGGEGNAVCHAVRDGAPLPSPPPERRCDVVIVGGGPSGLAAAAELQGQDVVLLEKEPHLGGNAYTESWKGLHYSTGAAWTTMWPEASELDMRFNLGIREFKGKDWACFDGKWVAEFWNGRADNPAFDALPFPDSVKKGFRQFLRDHETIDLNAQLKALDGRRFSELLKPYPAQLKAFWDDFGRSNWGARCENTSAYLGLQAALQWFREPRFTWEGGMGVGSQRLLAALPAKTAQGVLTGASVYRIQRDGEAVRVDFMRDGKARAVEARAAVIAIPKFFARHVVAGLPPGQFAAMGRIRYAPFMVYNLCFDRVVYNRGFDSWVVGARHFTDFIQADWVTHAESGDPRRPQVITVYAPKDEAERADLLDDEDVLGEAKAAVAELLTFFPDWGAHLREVRIYRRGHPMPMSTPGYFTEVQPLAARDLPPIYFAHSDSKGEVSDFMMASLNGIAAARRAVARLS